MNYEYRTAAWVAVQILAERSVSLCWDLSRDTFEWLRCETSEPVDDLMVGTSSAGVVLAQVKRSVRATQDPDDSLGSSIDQFVRQFHAHRLGGIGVRPWQRPLDPVRDRLILVCGPDSSTKIAVDLPKVLERLRGLAPGQPVEDAAQTKAEKEVLALVREHVRRSWVKVTNDEPPEPSLRELFALLRVQVLDLEEGGLAEHQAKDWLRANILTNPEQAELAWSCLISICADFASNRSGADRGGLHRKLLASGVQLRAPESYRADIERLRAYSARMLSDVSHLARIRVGDADVKIARPSTEAIVEAAQCGSVVVVGDPGAGKSGALHDAVQVLADRAIELVFLAVDHLVARSASELSADLALTHDLREVLRNWVGSSPGVLVIDALDAARADQAATMLRDLIRSTIQDRGRWHVVASIRKFDLRYSPDLAQLFAGEPPDAAFRDSSEFGRVRHINIPPLSDEELRQIAPQCEDLSRLVETTAPGFRRLLRNPFNLKLLADLLDAGATANELSPIATQAELLDRYWAYRVLRDDARDAREVVLRRACEKMVEARALRVDRAVIAMGTDSGALNDLLSCEVLTEWQPSETAPPERYIVAFGHHVLFDYATERLLLRGDPERLVGWLADEPELLIVIRPSLVLHFHELWGRDGSRAQCWDLILRCCRAGMPEIGKVVGPAVVVELASRPEDFAPLHAAIELETDGIGSAAGQAFRHVCGALLAAPRSETPLVGEGARPWAEFIRRSSRQLNPGSSFAVAALLAAAVEGEVELTSTQLENLGAAARNLLEYAWQCAPREDWLVRCGIVGVCRTFRGAPIESASLLRRMLEGEHFKEHAFRELPWIASEAGRLARYDPELVEQIYHAAFTNRDESEETTSMGSSRILALTSTRHQDYDGALYTLSEGFPAFMELRPLHATRAMLLAIHYYVLKRHHARSDEVLQEEFDFNGVAARLRTDYSAVWDGATYDHDNPLKLLNAFDHRMAHLAEANEAAIISEIIDIVVAVNRFAVVWKRLIDLGAKHYDGIGSRLVPLTTAVPILVGYDTTVAIGGYLEKNFERLSSEDRARCESAILSIPAVRSGSQEANERIRDRLLGCLAEDWLTTDSARAAVKALRLGDGPPPNEPPVRFSGWMSGRYGEAEHLAEQGVPIDAAPNVRVRELEEPLKAFAERHSNSQPTAEEIADILPSVIALRDELAGGAAVGVHPKQRQYAEARLAAACRCMAMSTALKCGSLTGDLTRDVLLLASTSSDPIHNPETDASFDKHPHWGSPATRVEAAEGLVLLARHPGCATAEVLEAIERLSGDAVPAVRYQIASRINALYDAAPTLMWAIINRLCEADCSAGVLQGLLGGPLPRIAARHPDEAVEQVKIALARFDEGEGGRRVRELCADIVGGLYVWRGHAICGALVREIVSDPSSRAEEIHSILRNLRQPLTFGAGDGSTRVQDAEIRARAFDVLLTILRNAHAGISRLQEEVDRPGGGWSAELRERARPLVGLVEDIGSEVYFASGAYALRQARDADEEGQISEAQRERFYREAVQVTTELAQAATPGVAHHLLETLETFVAFDPVGVFERIGDVVRGGLRGGYQYDPLAVRLVVALVERYLAEHRGMLRESESSQRILIEILDTFVRAGWPEAQKLAYRLDEIFR